jgi:copper(I)-binding protein
LNRTTINGTALFALCISTTAAWAQDSHDRGSQEIAVEHAEIVLSPPGARMMAGYLAIWNGTGAQAGLVSVESHMFGSISIHNTIVTGDVARMRPVEGPIPIPGHSELLMKRGGIHLMMSDPKGPLAAGDAVPIALVFEDGSRIATSARLLALGGKTIDHHHGEADGTGNE